MYMDKAKTILALYPNQWGIAYALFQGTKELIDCGVAYVQPACNVKCKKRVEHFLKYYEPDILILRESVSKSGRRIKRLLKSLEQMAQANNLIVQSFSRKNIRTFFMGYNATTKFEISKVLIKVYPQLERYEYPKRKQWLAEDPKTGVFDAVSLAVSYLFDKTTT